jgi:carbon storage regulator
MLVLSRKVGERIRIGDGVTITVVRITSSGVRLGIEAPVELPVVREELYQQMNRSPATPADAAEAPVRDDGAGGRR